ncbi:sigma-70 family RNA polymerase sigma factor [Chloroflexia bacterium SDU3-3]|nr:sigma-70 family RNA polymerase sigma factor [Chloroflexia bacterium SDU3-3]
MECATTQTITAAQVIELLDTVGGRVSYDQIETTLGQIAPDGSDDLYVQVLDALDQQGILVVEDLNAIAEDADAAAEASAQEVVALLQTIRGGLLAHPLLSVGQERRLLEIVADGQRAEAELLLDLSQRQRTAARQRLEAAASARDELIRCNMRLIAKIACRYVRQIYHLSVEDLIQEGAIGLNRAIERFDLGQNLRLSTYATWWVRQAITRAIADKERLVRLPVHVVESLSAVRRATGALYSSLGREPNDAEIAAATGLPAKKVALLRAQMRSVVSLDLPLGEDGSMSLCDVIASPLELAPDTAAAQGELSACLRDLLGTLTERERQVVSLRFGLDGAGPRTLEVVGQRLGVTRERVRQIEGKAMRKLRHSKQCTILQSML